MTCQSSYPLNSEKPRPPGKAGAFQPAEPIPETLKEWLLEAMGIDVKLFAAINDAGLRRWGLSRA